MVEVSKGTGEGRGIAGNPTIRDVLNGNGIEIVEFLPADLSGHDEMGAFQDVQVFHHPKAGHVEMALEVPERSAVTFPEEIEEQTPGGVSQRVEDRVHDDSNR